MNSKSIAEGRQLGPDEIEQQASEWIERRDFGQWTAATLRSWRTG